MDHALLCLGTSKYLTHKYVINRLYIKDSEIRRPLTDTRKVQNVPKSTILMVRVFEQFPSSKNTNQSAIMNIMAIFTIAPV